MNEKILERLTAHVLTKIVNQKKTPKLFLFDSLFTRRSGVSTPSVKIPIRKRAGIVLESVSPEADHLIAETADEYEVTVSLPRFPIENTVSASELNQINAISSDRSKLETLTEKIAEILENHKSDINTTIEYMCAGALFGKIMDGKGKVLFELSNNQTPVNFKTDSPIKKLTAVKNEMRAELGITPAMMGLCANDFFEGVVEACQNRDLFKSGLAKMGEKEGAVVLTLLGTELYPYSQSYKNAGGQSKDFLQDGKAIFAPKTPDAYRFFYGRADHLAAVQQAPRMYFSAQEKLNKGRGLSVITESKPMPACINPSAIIQAEWK